MNVADRLKEMGLSVYEVGTLNYLCRTKNGHTIAMSYGYDEDWNCYCWKVRISNCNAINYFLEEDHLIEAIRNYMNMKRSNKK